MSWLKVTTPGLSPDCGSFRAPGSRGRSSASAAPPSRTATAASIGMSFLVVMIASVSGEEELPGEVVPLVAGEGARDAVHRRAAVLQDLAELRGEAERDLRLGLLHVAVGRTVGEELPQVRGEAVRLHLEQPA